MCPVVHKPFAQKVAEVAPIVIGPLVSSVVEDYLTENPPQGGLTIEEIKADLEIADSLVKRHSNSPDHSHTNKTILDTVQEALTTILKTNYDTAHIHSQTTHAPSNAQPNNISDINAGLLTGGQETNLHSHAGGGGGLSQQQIEGLI
jgi:hypothetical protein